MDAQKQAMQMFADKIKEIHAVPRKPDFEAYLIDKHADQYTGLDDEMPEDYDRWVTGLDIMEVIEYANQWMKKEMEKNGKA